MSFQDIEPFKKLVWHHSSTDAAWNVITSPMMPDWPKTLLTSVTFDSKGDTTQVRLSQVPINPTQAEIECFAKVMSRMDKGWGSGFAILDTMLAEQQTKTLKQDI
jgi:Activator of Hsp90 ATPase homolog 1-like protein